MPPFWRCTVMMEQSFLSVRNILNTFFDDIQVDFKTRVSGWYRAKRNAECYGAKDCPFL